MLSHTSITFWSMSIYLVNFGQFLSLIVEERMLRSYLIYFGSFQSISFSQVEESASIQNAPLVIALPTSMFLYGIHVNFPAKMFFAEL